MNRWDELERLGQLRAEGLLSDSEFEIEKQRVLSRNDDLAADGLGNGQESSDEREDSRGWFKVALVVSAIMLVIFMVWMIAPTPTTQGNSSGTVVKVGPNLKAVIPPPLTTYALRSNVSGASLVRLDQLPQVSPYGDKSDTYCGEPFRPSTIGGRIAAQRGWRVAKEAKFHGLDAVLVVRGYDPGTSGHCFSKDPNLALFDGERLIGVLFSKGKKGIGMNTVENVGDHLRVWDDLSAVGQVNINGTDLSFDRITGNDAVCNGEYSVPAVFGLPYSKARRVLANAAWVLSPSTEEIDETRTQGYRARFPEVDTCSGTGYGYCNFGLHAADGVAKLSITTAGDDDDPVVVNYDISCDGHDEL